MKNALILVAVLLVIGGGYYVYTQSPKPITTGATPTPTSAAITSMPTTAETNELMQGGSSYLDPNGVFSILYPNDYKADSPGAGIYRFYKLGATQTGQTEMYDGVNVTIMTEALNGKTLEAFVDEAIAKSSTEGVSEVTEGKKAITFQNYAGFSYRVRGLGEFTYIVLQKNENPQYAVTIVASVQDPENVGFQKQVDAMLATIQILK